MKDFDQNSFLSDISSIDWDTMLNCSNEINTAVEKLVKYILDDHRKACAHAASESFGKVLPLDYYSAKSVSKNKRPSEKICGESWI